MQSIVSDLRKAGLTDGQIAGQIGCGLSTVSMWANGKRATRTGDYLLRLFRLHAGLCSQPPELPAERVDSAQEAA